MRYSCDQCDHNARRPYELKKLKERVHENTGRASEAKNTLNGKYDCDQCEYSTTDPLNLRKHIECKHLEVRYSCDECNFTGVKRYLVTKHKKKYQITKTSESYVTLVICDTIVKLESELESQDCGKDISKDENFEEYPFDNPLKRIVNPPKKNTIVLSKRKCFSFIIRILEINEFTEKSKLKIMNFR